jgi:hypothetical protein
MSSNRIVGAKMKIVVLYLASSLYGCQAGQNVVTPAADCGVAIVADALSGMTLEQIIAKEGARCSADILTVIDTLLSSTNPNVVSTGAYTEAVNLKARLDRDGGK